jgi:hypothetical protein
MPEEYCSTRRFLVAHQIPQLTKTIERVLFDVVRPRENVRAYLSLSPRYFTTKTEQEASRVKFCEVPPQM